MMVDTVFCSLPMEPGEETMPWSQTAPERERLRFVALHQEKTFTHTELCERFGISREAGYERLRRYEAEGISGLTDRSHAPKRVPHRIPEEIRAVLLETRAKHPSW